MANLTQEQLAAMQRDRQAGYYDPNGQWISQSSGGVADPANGDMFIGNYNASGMSPELMALAGRAPDSQYTYGTGGINGSGQIGDQYGIYTGTGEDTGQKGTYSSTTDADMWKTLATYAAILGSAGAAGGLFAGAGVPGITGGAGAAGGPGSAGWGMGLDSVTGGSGALEALGGASGMGAAGGAAGAGGGAVGTMAPMELLPASLGEVSLPGAMGAAGTAGAGGASAGGLLSGLGGGSNLLGLGATVLGGLAGAQGKEEEAKSTRDIPEWLKPYVQKNLGYASGLLDKQMAPGAMPGWEAMRNQGMGLLGAPQAGNGFSKFFPGR